MSYKPQWIMQILTVVNILLSGCGELAAGDPGAENAIDQELGHLSTTALQLNVLTNSCGASQAQDFFQVVNTGPTPVALSDIAIKFWIDDTSGHDAVPAVDTGGCVTNVNGNPSCSHPVIGVAATAAPFAPACGPDPGHQANWEVTITTTDHATLGPGAIWNNIQTQLHLSNFGNFFPGTDHWFSRCLTGSGYASDTRFAVYFQGNLVFSSGIAAPSCRAPHGTQMLTGYVTPDVANAPVIGPMPPSTVVHLAVGLPSPDFAGLRGFVNKVSDPLSPSYRHYLTPEQFAATYGADPKDYYALTAWAQSRGLVVEDLFANRLLLDISGTAADVEQALFVNLNLLRRPDGTQFFGPDREPSIDLSSSLLWVTGLNNFARAQHAVDTGSRSDGAYLSKDFRNAYACAITPDVSAPLGNGQTVGIVALDGYRQDDVDTYLADAGLAPVRVQAQLVQGVLGDRHNEKPEIEVDIESAISMAPGLAQVTVIEGLTLSSILYATAHVDPLPSQVSSSYVTDDKDLNVIPALYELASQGQTFFVASGDQPVLDAKSTYDIRSLDNVTVVGGSLLNFKAGNVGTPGGGTVTTSVYDFESAWNQVIDGKHRASTGGIMDAVAIPAYQQWLGSTNGASTTHRNIPDVAMSAQDSAIFGHNLDQTTGQSTEQSIASGTSISAPLWAGFAALINQHAASTGLGPLGFVNPVLYAIGRTGNAPDSLYHTMFHDVQIGGNDAFSAGPGYDLVTGLGSPTCALINQLAASSSLPVTAVAAGGFFTCAVRSGQVSCWGRNNEGQLGNGDIENICSVFVPGCPPTPEPASQFTPSAPIADLSDVSAIAAGNEHACTVSLNGEVRCWGSNFFGQLGNTDAPAQGQPTPVPVQSLGGPAKDVAAGFFHTCALMTDNTVSCWGRNQHGQLGDHANQDQPGPVTVQTVSNGQITTLTNVTAIAAGGDHSCALAKGSGDVLGVYCWGDNTFGQIGDGSTADRNVARPVVSASMLQPIAIATGDFHSCAITGANVVCWGQNSLDGQPFAGQLGDGTHQDSSVPVLVTLLEGKHPTAIAAGGDHSCAILPLGTVNCWGDNAQGDLGIGSFTVPPSNTGGTPVVNLGGVTKIAAGAGHTCAISHQQGTLSCWGDNSQGGELGDGTLDNRAVPVTVRFF